MEEAELHVSPATTLPTHAEAAFELRGKRESPGPNEVSSAGAEQTSAGAELNVPAAGDAARPASSIVPPSGSTVARVVRADASSPQSAQVLTPGAQPFPGGQADQAALEQPVAVAASSAQPDAATVFSSESQETALEDAAFGETPDSSGAVGETGGDTPAPVQQRRQERVSEEIGQQAAALQVQLTRANNPESPVLEILKGL
jgi:hypothetical protein